MASSFGLCSYLLLRIVKFSGVCQASIHAIKTRNSDVTSLRDFYCKKYIEGSPAFKLAQVNNLSFI